MRKLYVLFVSTLLLISFGCKKSEVDTPENKKSTPKLAKLQFESTFNFETNKTGEQPAGWSNYLTGKGDLGKWEIREDDGKKVLAQVSQENFGNHFDVIVVDGSNFQDVVISVKFKGVKGEEDQGGGPVWRYQDADNYYIARANPLENNYRVYKVVNGRRKQMASADIDIPTGEWHAIKISMTNDHIECFYDGKKYLETQDGTFKKSGKIGLWTKADAFTYFDDLEIKGK